MGVNVKRLRRDRPKIVKAIAKEASDRAKRIVLQAHTAIRTVAHPVRTGRLGTGWNVSLGAPDFTDPGVTFNAGTIQAARVNVQRDLKPGESAFIANGVPYGPHVEFGTRNFSPRRMATQGLISVGLNPQWKKG